MAEKLLMLALSPTMETGLIARWKKAEGDKVAAGDVLCEVETDKAVMDYESPADGVLLKIVLEAGSSASIGDLIGIVGQTGEDISGLLAEQPTESSEPPAESSEPPAESFEPPAESSEPPAESSEQPAESEKADETEVMIKASPLARKMAQQSGLQLDSIQGSGPAGRIVKADIEKQLKTQAKAPAGDKPSEPARPAASGQPADVVIPLSAKRRIIAQRLSESMFSAPHYYLKVSADMSAVLEARRHLNARPDTKVSLNAFIIKFVAEALHKHPMVNATWTGESIVQHGMSDIGLAVAQKDGLITPVVRNCGSKGILQIDQELSVLIRKALDQTLAPEEYSGATFTISNLGSYGIEEFTAIINPPGSAILALGEIRKVTVVQDDDAIVVRPVMKMTLSCDHRVIDGAVGAAFLNDLRGMLEEPAQVLY